MKTKRRSTDEFKAEAVGLLDKGGRSLSAVAREVDLAPPVLRSWRRWREVRRAEQCGLGAAWRAGYSGPHTLIFADEGDEWEGLDVERQFIARWTA